MAAGAITAASLATTASFPRAFAAPTSLSWASEAITAASLAAALALTAAALALAAAALALAAAALALAAALRQPVFLLRRRFAGC